MKILVTGATRGIGKSVAETLNGEIFATGRNEELLKKYYKKYFVADFTKNDDVFALGEYILKNDIDVIVNNAGEYIYSEIDKCTAEQISEIFRVNVEVPVYLTSCAVKNMKKNNWGRIINIGSISGAVGEANASLYSATKSAMFGFTKSLALELAQYNITVNTINPGWVDTDLGNTSIEDSEFSKEEIIECIPQKRFVTPLEIAKTAEYLLSENARGITGQMINICAGLSVGG